MKHEYNLTTKDGVVLGVYDQRVSGGTIEQYVGPFESTDIAKQYADSYTESWQMGYNGRASVTEREDKIFVRCTRWTSCD